MNKLSKTELKYTKSKPIDQLTTLEAIKVMIDEQMLGIKILRQNKKNLELIINSSYEHLSRFKKGRIIYCGAGTSARIGVQDGVELLPTFGWPSSRVAFIIAGGRKALTKSVENSEDDIDAAFQYVTNLKVSSQDVVICLSASGDTPFTCKVLEEAFNLNAKTIAISNNKSGKILEKAQFKIFLDTEQEVIAGSTRLKAGTSQKVCLNIISSLIMVKFGFVKSGLMSNLIPSNVKLRKRKIRISKELS